MPYSGFEIPNGLALQNPDWTVIETVEELKKFIASKSLLLGRVKGHERVLFFKKANPQYEEIDADTWMELVKKHKCYAAYDGNGFAKIFSFTPI